jgi:hypothetical protein
MRMEITELNGFGVMKFRRSYLVLGAMALVVLNLSGCMAWKARGTDSLNTAPLPSKVRLVLQDRSSVVMTMPVVSADTLKGNVEGLPVGFLLGNIVDVKVRRVSWTRTSILAVIVAAPLGLLVYLATCDCLQFAS